MSWVRIWVHAVFTTRNRLPIINKDFRQKLFAHIKQNAKDKGTILIDVNGYTDHVHCLFSLNKDQSLSKTLQLIKGESSHWVNKNKLCSQKFS